MDYVYYRSINIPIAYYVFADLIGFAAGLYYCHRSKSGIKALLSALLAAYMFLILSTTVLARPVHTDYQYMLLPFWSYGEILEGRMDLLIENIANVIMLAPVDFLLPIVVRLDGKKTVLIGFCSCSVLSCCNCSSNVGYLNSMI